MKSAIKIIPVILLMLLTASVSAASTDEALVRRYLLSAGANNGGKGRVMLRYAVSDANAFASVLIEMGGIEKNDALILANPSVKELMGGVSNLGKLIAGNRAEAPEIRSEVFVYYSGHADEDGLKLGSETLPWTDFRNAVEGLDADVKVAVLDACGSGAITRTKGGVARPVFMSDASSNMKGYAYLTSSNENEASQESDRIRGSFFTHALVSGMRGAADMTGNGRVTVNEAYQYAFNETLQSTQNTRAGTQHPSRDMNLTGTGDIVMTDLRQTSATLFLDAGIEGRFFIRDEKGNLFAELRKMGGRQIELGMPPGKYSVQMEASSRWWMANNVVVAEGQKTTLGMSDMVVMPRGERTVRRGEDGEEVNGIEDDEDGEVGGDDNNMVSTPAESVDSSMSMTVQSPSLPAPADSLASTSPDTTRYTPYSVNVNILGLSLAFGTGSDMQSYPVARGVGQLQFGIINTADEIDLFQAGVVNITNRAGGLQAGVVNIAKDIGYVQAGALNIAIDVGHVQAGNLNIAKDVGYVQAGNFNIANNVGYVQAGTVNIANNAGYVQAGIVNIAENAKYQFGVVNIAKHIEKTPIGVLSFALNGIYGATAYADAAGDFGMSLHTGMPWFYSLIEYSDAARREHKYRTGRDLSTTGYGIGTRFGMNGPVTLNLEIIRHYVGSWDDLGDLIRYYIDEQDDENREKKKFYLQEYHKLRLGVNYSPIPYLAVTGGVSVNGIFDNSDAKIKHKPAGDFYHDYEFKSLKARVWPSVYAGVTAGKLRAGKIGAN